VGTHPADEAFGEDYELPSDRAYSETCAGVAAIMLAWRLLLATGEPRYADAIERLLYNVIATSPADDGRSFFYANTLHQRALPEKPSADREQLNFGGGARAPWFEVSCCLPNLARLLASLSAYVATVDGTRLQVHQYADASIRTQLGDGRLVGVRVRTHYPEDGTVTFVVTETAGGPWSLGLRIPDWASGGIIAGPDGSHEVGPGVATLTRDFAVGDEVVLQLPVRTRWRHPDPRIDAVRDCVVAQRGPVVLCAESIDLPGRSLDDLWVNAGVEPEESEDGITVRGELRRYDDHPSAYHAGASVPVHSERISVPLVPYHRWARRGPSTMRVWLPRL